MLNLFKVNYNEVRLDKRGFSIKNPASRHHLETIGASFLDGYHYSLTAKSNEDICEFIDQKRHLYRGFSYEGAGMALVFKDMFNIRGKKSLPDFLNDHANKHTYMLHVGVGWAYAKLPFINIEKKLKNYDELLRWLIIDGYGFHQAYFKTKAYVREKKVPNLSPFAKHVFYQGLGRCLWFVCGTDAIESVKTLSAFSRKYHGDLWAGLGLACTYAAKANRAELNYLKNAAGEHELSFLQGATFAAKARQRAGISIPYTRVAVRTLLDMDVDEAALITDIALSQIPDNLSSPEKYRQWKSLIRQQLNFKTKKISKNVF